MRDAPGAGGGAVMSAYAPYFDDVQQRRRTCRGDAMKRVYLVGCGKKKLDRPAAARDLYTGALFQKSLAYAEREARLDTDPFWAVYILSAEHGLVGADDVLAPYDLALTQYNEGARYDWGLMVVDRLAEEGWFRSDVELIVLAGAVYADALQFGICDRATANPETAPWDPPRVVMPLAGLGIGRRLAWLNAHLDTPTEAPVFSVPTAAL